MQGYTTIVSEIWSQISTQLKINKIQGSVSGNSDIAYFSHIFLQAGVGSFAGGIAAAVVNAHKEVCPFFSTFPKIIVVEPRGAHCLFYSHIQGDGHLHGNCLNHLRKRINL